jgi:hypothetical protein
MGEMLEEIVDITIVYPEGAPGLWDFFGNRSREVIVDIRRMPVTRDLIGDYYGDPEFRSRFQDWLNGLWARKDEQMDRYLSG